MKKIDLKKYIEEQKLQIDNMLSEHILNVKLIPNKLYMILPNQRELKWDDSDNEVYEQLNDINEFLNKQLCK